MGVLAQVETTPASPAPAAYMKQVSDSVLSGGYGRTASVNGGLDVLSNGGASNGSALTVDSLLEDRLKFVKSESFTASTPIGDKVMHLNASPSTSTGAVPSTSKAEPAPPQPPPAADKAPLLPAVNTSTNWPGGFRVGAGLTNDGNTCYLNSALQCLLHTPPLARYLSDARAHEWDDQCEVGRAGKLCVTCAMHKVLKRAFLPGRGAFRPTPINSNLKKIAPTLRQHRQEDSHEFLRFLLDGMQQSCLFKKPPKLANALKSQTFVHQIFGGQLRSRVQCCSCKHASDTYDTMLDLSLDINGGTRTLRDALKAFVAVDQLRGSNKYRCEKCKKLVAADKSFSIEHAPVILTIHLKRFTATGRKINALVPYPETLELDDYMSVRSQDGPTRYQLYGVVHHSGSGPHSGHYTATVRASDGRWHHMNDEFVSSTSKPTGKADAYMLFYALDRGDFTSALAPSSPSSSPKKRSERPWADSSSKTANGSSSPPPLKKQSVNGFPRSSPSAADPTASARASAFEASLNQASQVNQVRQQPRPPQVVSVRKNNPLGGSSTSSPYGPTVFTKNGSGPTTKPNSFYSNKSSDSMPPPSNKFPSIKKKISASGSFQSFSPGGRGDGGFHKASQQPRSKAAGMKPRTLYR